LVCAYLARSGAWWRSSVPLSLTLEDRGNQIGISWDRNADAIRQGGVASLEIVDGGRTTSVALDADELPTGAVKYTRTSQRVFAGLRVGEAETPASFVGQPATAVETKPLEVEPVAETPPPELQEQADQTRRGIVNARSAQPRAVTERPKVVVP